VPAATLTVAGIATKGLLLDRAIIVPAAGAGALRVTVAWGVGPIPVAVKPDRVWAELAGASARTAGRTNRTSKACIRLCKGRAEKAEPKRPSRKGRAEKRGGHVVPTF